MEQQFILALRANHLSVTAQRVAVFRALEAGATRLPALADRLAGQLDRATVYRTVQALVRAGVVTDLGNKQYELGDEFTSHHHHLTCTRCGWRENFHRPALERQLSAIAREAGFRINTHQLELRGICARCLQPGG